MPWRRCTYDLSPRKDQPPLPGVFHRWATTAHEGEDGNCATDTNALIELPDGSIVLVYPERVKFDVPLKGGESA